MIFIPPVFIMCKSYLKRRAKVQDSALWDDLCIRIFLCHTNFSIERKLIGIIIIIIFYGPISISKITGRERQPCIYSSLHSSKDQAFWLFPALPSNTKTIPESVPVLVVISWPERNAIAITVNIIYWQCCIRW